MNHRVEAFERLGIETRAGVPLHLWRAWLCPMTHQSDDAITASDQRRDQRATDQSRGARDENVHGVGLYAASRRDSVVHISIPPFPVRQAAKAFILGALRDLF